MTIRNLAFFVQMVILYGGFAILISLIIGIFAATMGCVVDPPGTLGFTGCMNAEFNQLF